MVRFKLVAALLAAAFATAAGLGLEAVQAEPAGATATRPAFPVTIKAANGYVTIAKRPVRIVSLSPTATESLFAIGAGAQVIAVDDQSNYPATAPRTRLSGFRPNAEAIAAYEPDLVVTSSAAKTCCLPWSACRFRFCTSRRRRRSATRTSRSASSAGRRAITQRRSRSSRG
jgi:iron complex transport system substrate-binding protein